MLRQPTAAFIGEYDTYVHPSEGARIGTITRGLHTCIQEENGENKITYTINTTGTHQGKDTYDILTLTTGYVLSGTKYVSYIPLNSTACSFAEYAYVT